MRASCGFLPERTTLSTQGRCHSQLRPSVDAAASAPRVVKFVTTSDRRRRRRDHHQLLVVAVGASTSTSASSASLLPRGSPNRLTPSATGGGEARSSTSSSAPPSSSSSPFSLVLYSKKDCPLCQGLEEKVRAALARGAFLPGSKLKGVSLEVRDIEAREEWRAAFAMEVPVLFWRKKMEAAGGIENETPIPRSPPRTTVEKLSTTLEAAMPLE